MSATARTSPAESGLAAARMEARVVLTQPSALCFLQDWDRALERACEVTRRAGVPEDVVRDVCEQLRATARTRGLGPEWVVHQVRRELAALLQT